MNSPAPSGPPGPPPAPPVLPGLKPVARAPVRLGRLMLGLLVLGVLMALAAPLALVATLRSEGGSTWLLGQVPGLQVIDPKGALWGDFSARRIEWLLPGPGDKLVLEDAAWQGLKVDQYDGPKLWAAVHLRSLQARRAEWMPAARPINTPPTPAPGELRLPFSLQIDRLTLGELHWAALGAQPLRALDASLHLGAQGGTQHLLELRQLQWDRLQAQGRLKLGADAPMPVDLALTLQALGVQSSGLGQTPALPSAAASDPPAAPTQESSQVPAWADAWRAEARLTGPLTRPQLRVSVQGIQAEAASPRLEADAVLLPFAAWPLAELQARTRELDLSSLVSAAPRTRLSGSASIGSSALDQPAKVSVSLDNSAAGRWNEGRLPVRSLRLELQARPDAPQIVTLRRFEADLGSARASSGRVSGSGHHEPGRWALDAVLDQLDPSGLDARAPAMRLSGPVYLGSADADADADAAAGAGANASRAATTGSTAVRARAKLTGMVSQPGQAARSVQLTLDTRLKTGPAPGALQLEILQAEARDGGASAQLAGQVQRPGEAAPWQIKADTTLQAFDPRTWWPGTPGSAWRRGPHRLDGRLTADLSYQSSTPKARPADAPGGREDPLGVLLAALAPVRGQANLLLRPSVLAGVPLEAQAQLSTLGEATEAATTRASVSLSAAGNRLQGKLQTVGNRPAADEWQVELDAPTLASLAPAAAALGWVAPAAGGRTTLAGRLVGQAQATGRWPELRTSGKLSAQGLRSADLTLQRGELQWQLGTTANAPVQVAAELTQLAWGTTRADTLKLSLQGSAREHQLSLNAGSNALPPAWAEALAAAGRSAPPVAAIAAPATPTAMVTPPSPAPAGATTASRTSAQLQLKGQLQFGRNSPVAAAEGRLAPWAATGWRGQIEQLQLRSGNHGASPLALSARQLDIEATWGTGQAQRVAVQPGRLELRAGATQAALRWSRMRWQAATPGRAGQAAGNAQMDIDAELEPMAVAPLLARLQPEFGWGGDLQVGGRIKLESSPRLKAEVVLERQRGDLSVTDETGTQALGLSDLRLALNADDGVWNFTQALAGSTLGVAAGAVVARTGSATAWPDANTPLQGVIELQVANLGTWGNWVPAGWRLGGQLRTSASLGGRLGAPEYTGEVRGKGLSVRNFAEGVNLSEGEVAIALQGETARIDRFSARAGKGTVELSGGASFGSAPQARLKLVADKFQLLGRVDRRVVASGQGQLLLEAGKIALDGDFRVDEGLIDFTRTDAPSLADDVVVVRAPAPAASGVQLAVERSEVPLGNRAPPTAAQRTVALKLRVNLGEQLRLRGRGLDTGLRGELLITSPGGRLAVNGTLSTAGGSYNAYGQKLSIDRGRIVFTGRIESPQLDIEATRPNVDVRVGVSISGTAGNPRIRLFSEPELPEVDKLSWLVLGRATDGLGRTDTALLQRAAVALLAGEGGGLTDKLTSAIGLDELSLRQTDGEVRETVLSVGKQLSRRWYVGYERGLNATAGTWQLIYRIAQRFTLRAQGGFENSLDVIWTWRWQ